MKDSKRKVLIVDSNEDLLIALERLLEDEGIDTVTTWSPRYALELIKAKGFDLVIAGDYLPGLSCQELLREVQRIGSAVSVLVLCSARAGSADFEALGAKAIFGKRDFGALLEWVKSYSSDQLGKQVRAA